MLWVSLSKRLGSCAAGTRNVFGNNPWDQGKRQTEGDDVKGASQQIQVLGGQGGLGEKKNRRNKDFSDSFIYLFVQ